ncbi:MAG: thiol:disulfide interchange protein [Verrucomicrobia bacterium]|jgi:thiol:disulfide interchange protein DsbD|nr:thiol:disulfide interchange protein [Verrucomicrobiota bacterium]
MDMRILWNNSHVLLSKLLMEIFIKASLLFVAGVLAGGHLPAKPVQADHTTVELIAEDAAIVPGQSFDVAIRFEMDPHWHIYWKNPGASGLPLEINWDLPEGIEAGEIEWPAPERIPLEGLVNYGYEGIVTFIVPMRASESLQVGEEHSLRAELFWLICKEVCLPGEAVVELSLPVADKTERGPEAAAFEAARDSQPKTPGDWTVSAALEGESILLEIVGDSVPEDVYFYAESTGVVDPNAEQVVRSPAPDTVQLRLVGDPAFLDEPSDRLRGVLQSTDASWELSVALLSGEVVAAPEPEVAEATSDGPPPTGFEQRLLRLGLPGFVVLAFLGGLILNIMPCVLPVLSLKVFSLLKHAGQARSEALKHGLAYTLGVVVSFLVLAGALFALRAVGERIGWGFQLQSPGFVVVLTAVFFIFGLNLLGVFELGGRLVGADAGVAKRNDVIGSFGMGVLAAVVGAPCMGPLVAGVSGLAVQANTATGLLIFGMMGFGLASPFLFLSIFPKLVAFLPKPGLWMESFKQAMGFLLMAAVVFLALVAGRQGGVDAIIVLLLLMLLCAVGAWVFGRWGAASRSRRSQRVSKVFAALLIVGSLVWAMDATQAAYANFGERESTGDASGQWTDWSEEKVQANLAEGRPVFVDFTATWCLICQVNKKVALRTEATAELFEDYGIVALTADWTRYDPEITDTLEAFGRSGVPLYLLYAPDGDVMVLPQNLSSSVIREAVERAL